MTIDLDNRIAELLAVNELEDASRPETFFKAQQVIRELVAENARLRAEAEQKDEELHWASLDERVD